MSTSEKPAKKAATKKTAKKAAAKKTATKPPLKCTWPECDYKTTSGATLQEHVNWHIEQSVESTIAMMAQDPTTTERLLGFNPDNEPTPLAGTSDVTLTLPVEAYHTNQAAEFFIRDVLEYGLRHFWLKVTSSDGNEYWVHDNQTYTKEQVESVLENEKA